MRREERQPRKMERKKMRLLVKSVTLRRWVRKNRDCIIRPFAWCRETLMGRVFFGIDVAGNDVLLTNDRECICKITIFFFFSRQSSKEPTKVTKRKRRRLFRHTHLQLTGWMCSDRSPEDALFSSPFSPSTYVVVFDFATPPLLSKRKTGIADLTRALSFFVEWLVFDFFKRTLKVFFYEIECMRETILFFFSLLFYVQNIERGRENRRFSSPRSALPSLRNTVFFFLRISFLCYNILYIYTLFI